jgi:hypothetical protein
VPSHSAELHSQTHHEYSDESAAGQTFHEAIEKFSAGRKNEEEVPSFTLKEAMMGTPSLDAKSDSAATQEPHIAWKMQEDKLRAGKETAKTKRAGRPEKKVPRVDGKYVPLASRHSTMKEMKESLLPKSLVVEPLAVPQPPVPYLSYGLDRVLFNPGVYSLQDPSSRVYNFDPYLEKIMPVHEFDFGALKEYKTSSRDTALAGLAQKFAKKYIGSTSSMTSMLAQFHFCLSRGRLINIDMMSKGFGGKVSSSRNFTKINRAPAAIFLRYKDGRYAIDADKEYDSANVLMLLGKSLELLLTLPKSQYEIYRKSDPRTISEAQKAEPESYQYTTMGDFLMRSQLDSYDHRLPGNGTFDLKTRAVLPIRMDSQNYLKNIDYEIESLGGTYKSYEREKYDMMRATMLKYMLQVRMGRMTGIFVAYHNVRRMFGFEYIPLREMDYALHGTSDPCLGDQEFKASLELLNIVFEKATTKYPETSLRFLFEAKEEEKPDPTKPGTLNIFAEPMTEAQVDAIQNRNKASIAEAERIMMEGLDLAQNDPAEDRFQEKEEDFTISATPIDAQKNVEDSATSVVEGELDDHGTSLFEAEDSSATSSHDYDQEESLNNEEYFDDEESPDAESSAESALTSSAEDDEASTDESPTEVDEASTNESAPSTSTDERSQVLHIKLQTRNKVNGQPTLRPERLRETDQWRINYLVTVTEACGSTKKQVLNHYRDVKARRRQILTHGVEDADLADGETPRPSATKSRSADFYFKMLANLVKEGREYRAKLDKRDAGKEKVVYETFGPGIVDRVNSVDSYMGWLYTAKAAPEPASEPPKDPADKVKNVESYMDWLYGKK